MSRAQAQREARIMAEKIRAHGVEVLIDLMPGAGSSGWYKGTHRLVMSHHTASRPSQGNTPALGVVKRGRPDVPGPLANGYMGYDGVYRILTFGWANHPGAGGPITLDGVRIPKNNARPYTWGTEFEGGYEPYSDFMHDRMARANAGLTDYFAARGMTDEGHLEHKTWAPGRKVDRIGYTRASSIARIKAARKGIGAAPGNTPTQEDDMANVTDAQLELLVDGAEKARHVYEAVFNGSKANGRTYPAVVETLRQLPSLNWSASMGRGENRRTLAEIIVATHRAAVEATALREVLGQVTAGQAVDYDRIAQIVRDNTPDAIDVTVTVDDNTKES